MAFLHLLDRPIESMEVALQSFSVPQHLLETDLRTEAKMHHGSLLVARLRAHCKLELQRAIEQNGFGSTDLHARVHVDKRVLHRVAL